MALFDYSKPEDWPQCPSEVVYLLGHSAPIYVRPYTLAQYRDVILPRARAMQGLGLTDKAKPSELCLLVATTTAVCYSDRTGDGRAFRLESGCEKEGYLALVGLLPMGWMQEVVSLANSLALSGFYAPHEAKQSSEAERVALHEALAEPDFQATIAYQYARLYSRPLADDGQSVGEVLTAVLRAEDVQQKLLAAMTAVGKAAGRGPL